MSSIAQFPVNVRLEHTDGSRTPLEFVHDETDKDGVAIWTSVHEYPKKDDDAIVWDLKPDNVKLHVRYQS